MEKRFVASLTDSEQQALAYAYQHGEKRALRCRAHAILLSDQGHTINQISEILQVRRDAVSRWFKQWEASGLDGLIDKPRSGRTPALDEHDHQLLQALVAEHPHQIRALQARFQEETGKSVATVTLRRALKKKGHSFKRIRHSLKAQRNETDFRNTQGLMKALHEQEDSLIETAKANGLSPYDYLQYVFKTLPTLNDDELTTLLPWHWKETLPA